MAGQTPFERCVSYATLLGTLAVLVGVTCLLLDLGRIDRVLSLFVTPSPSIMAVGAYVLAALAVAGAVHFAYVPWFPITAIRVVKVTVVVLAAAAFVLLTAGSSHPARVSSAHELLCGDLAPLWWVGFVACGLAVPLVVEAVVMWRTRAGGGNDGSGAFDTAATLPPAALLCLAALVLAGGLSMRFGIAEAGRHRALELQDPIELAMQSEEDAEGEAVAEVEEVSEEGVVTRAEMETRADAGIGASAEAKAQAKAEVDTEATPEAQTKQEAESTYEQAFRNRRKKQSAHLAVAEEQVHLPDSVGALSPR